MTITYKGAKEGCKNAECVVVDLRFGNLEFISRKSHKVVV